MADNAEVQPDLKHAVDALEAAQAPTKPLPFAEGGVVPYHPNMPSEVFSVQDKLDAVKQQVASFNERLEALAAAVPNGAAGAVDTGGLRVPTLVEDLQAEEAAREAAFEAARMAMREAAAAAPAAASATTPLASPDAAATQQQGRRGSEQQVGSIGHAALHDSRQEHPTQGGTTVTARGQRRAGEGAASGQTGTGEGAAAAVEGGSVAAAPVAAGESRAIDSGAERTGVSLREAAAETVKRRRLERIGEAAQHLASVAAVAREGIARRLDRRFLPQQTATDAAAAAPLADAADGAAAVGGAAGPVQRPGACGGDGRVLSADEMLLHVQMHHPEVPSRAPREYLVPASLRLSDLRDALYCVSDVNAAAAAPHLASRSAYFYFEGVFYLDTRHAGALDYSKPLREYCARRGIKPPGGVQHRSSQVTLDEASGFGTAPMQDVSFSELCLQLHSGRHKYLFCHQGACEHAITVTGMRRLHPDDPQHASAYPLLAAQGYHHSRICCACSRRNARRVTHGDPFAHSSPAFWCEQCYAAMHLGPDGRRLRDDYVVQPYVHE